MNQDRINSFVRRLKFVRQDTGVGKTHDMDTAHEAADNILIEFVEELARCEQTYIYDDLISAYRKAQRNHIYA